jgi:multimeric flavodoxin WrbA
VCQAKGEEFCPNADDLTALVARLKASDGVILVSPAYANNISGLMKNLFDRLAWASHRPPFRGKPAMLVVTGSAVTRSARLSLAWFADTGFHIVALVEHAVWPSPNLDWHRGPAEERKLRTLVARFKRAASRKRTSLSFSQVVMFHVMKAVAQTDPEFFRADHEYHRDITALGFKVAWWKNAVGKCAGSVVTRWFALRLRQRP